MMMVQAWIYSGPESKKLSLTSNAICYSFAEKILISDYLLISDWVGDNFF